MRSVCIQSRVDTLETDCGRVLQGSRQRQLSEDSRVFSLPTPNWDGQCFYGASRSPNPTESEDADGPPHPLGQKAVCVTVNERFSLVALGLERCVRGDAGTSRTVGLMLLWSPTSGQCALYSVIMPSQAFMRSHHFSLRNTLKSTAPHLETGSVTTLAWTSDGYALAVGWTSGWSVWTVYGKLTTWAVGGDAGDSDAGEPSRTFEDRFMKGVDKLVSTYRWLLRKSRRTDLATAVLGSGES